MMFDTQSMFSDAQAVTATAASTNQIDFGAPQIPMHAKAAITQDVGRGTAAPIRIQVVEAFVALTSLKIDIEVDDDVSFGSAKVVASVTVPAAELVAGYVAPMSYLPRGMDERYARLNYTVVGDDATAGKITAGYVFGNEAWSA
ncbi:major capsid protein [Octadecabacter Antarctic BD virus 1]|nr:major capsid protein [Octadecabacter Antarctic BD virus 1]